MEGWSGSLRKNGVAWVIRTELEGLPMALLASTLDLAFNRPPTGMIESGWTAYSAIGAVRTALGALW